MTLRLAVTGATGRMGRTVRRTVGGTDGVEVALAASRSANADEEGDRFVDPESLASALENLAVDALIDFTVPSASLRHVAACVGAGVPAVVGTTGFDDGQLEELHEASEAVPVIVAPNFSRGVEILTDLVAEAAAALPGFDVELTETHHAGKRDAPSGTAKRLLRAVEGARPVTERVHGRHGERARSAGEIGVHARRAGTIPGDHEVLLAGDHEVLSLRHRAEDRGVFAVGAIDAARWLAGREPGWYEFSDVLRSDSP